MSGHRSTEGVNQLLKSKSSNDALRKRYCPPFGPPIWNKRIFQHKTKYYGLQQKKTPRKYCSKMVMSVVMNRNSQSNTVQTDKENSGTFERFTSESNPSLRNTCTDHNTTNYYEQSHQIATKNADFTVKSEDEYSYNIRLQKTQLYDARIKNIYGSVKSVCNTEIYNSNAQNDAVFSKRSKNLSDNLLPVMPNKNNLLPLKHHNVYVNDRYKHVVTSDSFLPSYLETLRNDNHPVSLSSRSGSVSLDSNDSESEVQNTDTDFVLNISKNPCNDVYMKMSALELLASCKESSFGLSRSQYSPRVNKNSFNEDNSSHVNSDVYSSPVPTIKNECSTYDDDDSPPDGSAEGEEGDDNDDDDDDDGDEDEFYNNEAVEFVDLDSSKSQEILDCSETLLDDDFEEE